MHTTQEIIDLIILDQFLTDLSGSSQRWVQRHQPKTMEEVLRLAEDYASAEGEGEIPKQDLAGGPTSGIWQSNPIQP